MHSDPNKTHWNRKSQSNSKKHQKNAYDVNARIANVATETPALKPPLKYGIFDEGLNAVIAHMRGDV